MSLAEDAAKGWVQSIKLKYVLDTTLILGNNKFFSITVKVNDPSNKGASFEVSFNDKGDASMIEMENFHFGRFNIAEGFTSEDILSVANSILEAKFVPDKSFLSKKLRLCFALSESGVCAKAVSASARLPMKYTAN